ncbi:dyslexia-associated protein KIAA0319 isoform X1 [Patella vulgata]|uniref:dyslexia-associated protein KIAA0319 isoform X1 n=2 Tax=Patella vulgata TaxID=6465 RepID=UPI0021804AF3|nr:dyslexia-associated protein KIAA0319 isoform X1 [Patella vulgata]
MFISKMEDRKIGLFFVMSALLISECYGTGTFCDGNRDNFDSNIHPSAIPTGGKEAGKYLKVKSAQDLVTCVNSCCLTTLDNCDIVFFHQQVCYWIKCNTSLVNGCEPKNVTEAKFNQTFFITVKHVVYDHPAAKESSPPTVKSCEYGIRDQCSDDEECVLRKDNKSRFGICHCKKGLERSSLGNCIPPANTTVSPDKQEQGTTAAIPHSTTVKVTKLTVSAGEPKVIQLPNENSVSLSAAVVPSAPEGEVYHYTWSLVSSPNGADEKGQIASKNTDTVKISNLIAGVYTLKIQVTGENKLGESLVNVTVLPPARKNQEPVAIIKPTNQEIKLPNSGLLDGSDSKDDDKIVSYHWEEVNGPLQAHQTNGDASMLNLKGLAPGNYTFKLTVTDSDGATNSTQANVTVVKETDYPPKANAGSDIVIRLPQTSAVLYGNASTDDKEIKSYEWTKTSDNKVTQDVSGVRTPFLHLNNLEVGDYTYTLKVTDSSGQSSTADVHVFVKPESNKPPVAKTANKLTVVLPADNIILDGSNSTDDNKLTQYTWQQTGGPTALQIMNSDRMVASATGALNEGTYEFELQVKDNEGIVTSAKLTVTTKTHANLAPIAKAGGDKVVYLPLSFINLDGRESTDDHGIVQYHWKRDLRSLATGDIINGSDSQAVLQLVNLVAGRYIFSLTVVDSEGLSNSDSASVIVKEDPNRLNALEMLLDTDVNEFTEENKERIASQLKLLIHQNKADGETIVDIQHIGKDMSTGHLHIQFLVKTKYKESEKVANGVKILSILKHKLQQENDILDFKVISIDTVVCQNNCSGHGHCDIKTKLCVCEAFWMENIFTSTFFLQESNCEWSILYVVIVCFVIVISIAGGTWVIICLCRSKKCSLFHCKLKTRKRHRYSLLNTREEDIHEMKEHKDLLPKGKIQNSSVMMSESDFSSEEETLFVNSKKTNGHALKPLNGFTKNHYKSKLRT